MYQHFNHEFASILIDTKLTSRSEEEPTFVLEDPGVDG